MKHIHFWRIHPRYLALILAFTCHAAAQSRQPTQAQIDQRGARPMLHSNLDRTLRYSPNDGDFLIVNGDEWYNRSLYGGSSPFRVDGGDLPEFSFYLPGRGGNLRLGFATSKGMKWLSDAERL